MNVQSSERRELCRDDGARTFLSAAPSERRRGRATSGNSAGKRRTPNASRHLVSLHVAADRNVRAPFRLRHGRPSHFTLLTSLFIPFFAPASFRRSAGGSARKFLRC